MELSRGFKALKVWMGLKTHGAPRLRRPPSSATCASRGSCPARSTAGPSFERLADAVLSIANFRYRPADRDLPDAELDRVNRTIVNRLVGEGSFFLAPTVLKGRTALRVSITNFRTREEDLIFLLDEAERIGRSILR